MSQNVCSGGMPNSDIDGTAISKKHVQMGQDGDLGRTVRLFLDIELELQSIVRSEEKET